MSGEVRLAVRDFGGVGPDLVLVHGLGRTLVDWTAAASLLTARHRVVAYDLRCHGASGDGPWSWSAAVDDLAAVAARLGMANPAVAGHSLGGMIAVMWAERRPDCPGAVNLDGHGASRPDQYVGLGLEAVAERRAEATALMDRQLAALSAPLSPPQVEALVEQQRSLAARSGLAVDVSDQAIRRMLRRRGGDAFLRPSPGGVGRDMLAAAEGFDMFGLYERVRCPLLIVSAEEGEAAPTGPQEPGAPRDPGARMEELMAAYRKGLLRDLRTLAARRPEVRVAAVEGGYGLVFERPQLVAELIAGFLGG